MNLILAPSTTARQALAARQKVIATWSGIKPLDTSVDVQKVERATGLIDELKTKARSEVLVVVHSYQRQEVKMLADLIGDSFALAQAAQNLPPNSIVLHCTVNFMAETTKILRPDLKVIVPSHYGGCGLADYITGPQIRKWKAAVATTLDVPQTELPVVLYINTYASAKAEATVICTSSNSLKVIESLPNEHVLFAPDSNLYHSIKGDSTKDIIPWHGSCPIHQEFTAEMVQKAVYGAQDEFAGCKIGIMLHPECNPEVREYVTRGLSDYTSAVRSTQGMQDFVRAHPEITVWIVGTEIGLIESLRTDPANKGKIFKPVYAHKSCDESCVCPYMKSVSIEGIIGVLEGLLNRSSAQVRQYGKIIGVARKYADPARDAIRRMVEIGRGEGQRDGRPGY